MHRLFALVAAALLLSLGLGIAVYAQDQSTPAAGEDVTLCATPVAELEGTPAMVVTAPAPAASPGGSAPGTPIGLVPCGTPNPMGETQGAAQNTAITIEMVDIAFNPNAITIPANTDVTITLPNNGVALHNFNIDALGIKTEDVASGGSTTVTINAPAGTYEYYCSIPGHREAGMTGTITVQ